MKKSFLLNILLLLGINGLVKPFYVFGVDLVVQNRLGESVYGWYFALFSFTYIFQILSDFGMQNYIRTVFGKAPHLLAKYLPKLLTTKLLLSLTYVCFVLLASVAIGYNLRDPILWILIANQLFNGLFQTLRAAVAASGRYVVDSILSAVDKVMLIGIMVYILYIRSEPVSIQLFAGAQCLSLVLACLICVLCIPAIFKQKWMFSKSFNIYFFKQMAPFALVVILMSIYTRVDAVMIERLLQDGKSQAGIYAAAYRLLDAMNILGLLFATLLMPMFAKTLEKKEELRSLLRLSFGAIWSIAVLAAACLFVMTEWFYPILYIESDEQYTSIFKIMLIVFLGNCVIYIYSTILTAAERFYTMNIVFLLAIILNILTNLTLIPLYAAQGAAIASLATQSFVAIAMIVLCIRHKILNVHLRFSSASAALALFYGLLTYNILPFDTASLTTKITTVLAALLATVAYAYYVFRTSFQSDLRWDT